MSLFSKLFSRDEKGPEESEEENALATASDPNESARKPEGAAAGGGTGRDANAPAAATKKTEQTAVGTSSDKTGHGAQPPAAAGKQTNAGAKDKDARAATPADGAAKAPPLKAGAPSKRDRVQARTMQGLGTIPNAGARPPTAAVQPEPAGGAKPNVSAPNASAATASATTASATTASATTAGATNTAAVTPAAVTTAAANTAASAVAATKASPSPAPRQEPGEEPREEPPTTIKQTPMVSAADEPTIPRLRPSPLPGTARIPELPSAEVPTVEVKTVSAYPTKSTAHFDAAFDAAMNALVEPTSLSQPPRHDDASNHDSDQRAVAETFAEVAKVHAHPLHELMFQLGVGRTPRQWASASRPVLRPLLDAAQQIGLLELVGALGAFDAALERASAEPGACIGEQAADALKSAYERLCRQMPAAFTPPSDSDGRRRILLESLLLQIPDLHRRTLAKLYAAGLSSLAQLGQASPDELCAVAGLERRLAENVVEHVQRFERDRSRVNPSDLRSQACEKLRAIAGRISQLHADFERAEHEESVERKRAARRGREAALLELDLVFAEIGEVSVIEELKRCAVQAKLRRVSTYLEDLQASA